MQSSRSQRHSPEEAFTLIEILIVMSIIAMLSGLGLAALRVARTNALIATTSMEVRGLRLALDNFVDDEGEYPGLPEAEADPATNELPALYRALFGRRRPRGEGGRHAPYMTLPRERVAVLDPGTGEPREVSRTELVDDAVEKLVLDPFRSPYIYRLNKGRPPRDWARHPEGAEIYSLGPNERDDTLLRAESGDDIGN